MGGILFLIDYTVTRFIYIELEQSLLLAQWCGRFVGAAAGFGLHRNYSFNAGVSSGKAAYLRYWLITLALWVVSPGVLTLLVSLLPNSFLAAKVVTECILACVSYSLLRHFVFR